MIRGNTDGLTDDRNARRPVTGRARVRQRRRWVLVDQRAGGDEVAGDALDIARVQAPERATHRGVEVAGIHPVGQLRPRRQRRTPLLSRRTRTSGAPRRTSTAVVGGTPLVPVASVAARSTGTLRTITGGAISLRLAVLPLRTITGGTVTLRPSTLGPFLPLARSVARPNCALGCATGLPVPVRATLLPIASLGTPVSAPVRTVALRSTVLPLRTITGRPVGASRSGTVRALT